MRSFLLTFIGLLFGSVLMAQTSLQGKVTDGKKEGLFSANIKLLKGGALKAGAVTDLDGNYSIGLDPGTYDLEVSYTGYKTVLMKNVRLQAGITTFQDITMDEEGITLDDIVIREYKAPLFQKDNTSGGRTVTSEEISKMPTRSVTAIAAASAGVSVIDGGDANIKGSRSNATQYYLDGIRVTGTLPPTQEIDQLQVVTGGVEAQYGDLTGGLISVTSKGPSKNFAGGLEFETSKGLDPYGFLLLNGNVSGPIIKKDGNTVLGFRLSGQYQGQDDDNPRAFGVWVANQDVVNKIEANPIRRVGASQLSEAEYLRTSDFTLQKARPNEGARRIDFTGKLDAKLTKDIDLTLSGTYFNNKDQFTPGGWQELNTAYNPFRYETRYRGNVRFRHRLGGNNANAEKNKNSTVLKNLMYTVQFGYENVNNNESDPRHGDRLFDYGYVGKFERDYVIAAGQTNYQGIGTNCPPVKVLLPGTDIEVPVAQVGTTTKFIKYTPSSINPLLTNYNKIFDPTVFEQLLAINGRLSSTYSSVWSSTTSEGFTNTGAVFNSYSKSQTQIMSGNANLSFDLLPGGSEKGRHSLQLGFLYEQRLSRNYSMNPNALWQVAQQSVNNQIVGLDTTQCLGTLKTNHFVFQGVDVTVPDSFDYPYFKNAIKEDPDLFFYKEVRANNGNVSVYDYFNVDKLTPDQLSLKMFAPKELTDYNDLKLRFSGYDYLGNALPASTKFNDFFAVNPKTGRRDFLVAPSQPNYIAGFIQDKFTYKDIIFRVGLRIDQFDANTKVMKDPFSLYQIVGAKDFHDNLKTTKPANIGNDYKVYVEGNGSDAVKAYRNGEQWYYPNGNAANDGILIFGGESVSPKYVKQNGKDPDITLRGFDPNSSFTDYKPKLNFMPRLAFSFPISDDANFFAHYDVLTQRPPNSNVATALDYFYFFYPGRFDDGDNPISNPNLKPERTVDYEVGFQQKISNSSAIKLTAYYKELRDNIQRRAYQYVPVLGSYTTYDNRDFATVKGFTANYDLRRTNNFQLNLAYTLQFADGTGSDENSQRGLSSKGNLRNIFPLNFDERHNFSATLDYRYDEGKKYTGPRALKSVLENLGVNFQIFTASGRPYTRKLTPSKFGGDGTVGQINGSNKPWRYTVDMRIDKTIHLTKENSARPMNLNVFLRIQNLFDTRNVIGVFPATGSPSDDGYLVSRLGRDAVRGIAETGRDAISYLQSYQRALLVPGNYTLPRRIFLGASVNF